MDFDVTVAVATYGGQEWIDLAQRALASAAPQAPVVHVHGDSLHGARNQALEQVATEFVIYLDADDELAPGYIDAMGHAQGDLRVPRVQYLGWGITREPYFPRVWGHHHACAAACLPEGNWIVIGAAARAQLLRDIGGWRDFAWSEDWDVWLRCHLAGADIQTAPDAVYRAHVRPESRNRAPEQELKLRVHQEIYRANFPQAAA